jgi:hypothetical protein
MKKQYFMVLFNLLTSLVYGVGSGGMNNKSALEEKCWKLEAFVYTKTGESKRALPNDSKCYKLIFDSDTTFYGFSSTNTISGSYSIDYKDSIIKVINIIGTEIIELGDGKLFMSNLNSIQSFSINETELKLFYDDGDSFLLFISEITSSNEEILEHQYLYNNSPNPFHESTIIKYSLPNSTTNAYLMIYSISGFLYKKMPLNVNEKNGSIKLFSFEFQSGIYIYSLVANGVLLSTKKMINQ